jgi:hypothetical protein
MCIRGRFNRSIYIACVGKQHGLYVSRAQPNTKHQPPDCDNSAQCLDRCELRDLRGGREESPDAEGLC